MPRELSGETVKRVLVFLLVLLFSVPFGYYYGITYRGNGAAGAATGLVIGIVVTAAGLAAAGRLERLFYIVAWRRRGGFSLRERLESDLQQIRYHKMRKEWDIALRKANDVLMQDPDYPEALFLKAQIVWEGFGNRGSAVSNLERVKTTVDDHASSIYRWSCSLLKEIEETAEER